jgi:hypothetical protein
MDAGASLTIWRTGHWEWKAVVSSGDTNDTWEALRILLYDAAGTQYGYVLIGNFHMTSKDHKYNWVRSVIDIPNPAVAALYERWVHSTFSCKHC